MDTFSIVSKKKKYDTFLRKIKNPPSKCWIMNSKYKRPLFRNHGSQWHRTMAAVKAMASESCFYGASVCLDFTNHLYTQRRRKIWLNWTKMPKQCLVSIQFFNGWHWVGIWLAFACLSETLNIIMSATNSNQCHIKIKTYTKYNREAEWFTRFAHKTDFLKTATRAIKRKKKKTTTDTWNNKQMKTETLFTISWNVYYIISFVVLSEAAFMVRLANPRCIQSTRRIRLNWNESNWIHNTKSKWHRHTDAYFNGIHCEFPSLRVALGIIK